MYRTIDTRFWTDPKVRQLNTNNKLLFLYFITSPHAHFSGIYYLPKTTTSHETGIRLADVTKGIDTLSMTGIVMADTLSELIWVVNMFRYQSHSEKLLKGIANHLGGLHNSALIGDFLEHYSELEIPYQYPIAALSDKEQEKEQEKEEEIEQDKEESRADISEDFDQFWQHFITMNRKDGKVKAQKAWATTLKGRPGKDGHKPVEPSTLIEAANHYRMLCEQEQREPKHIKQPATFLGPDRHWEDFSEPPKPSGNGDGLNRGAAYYEKARGKGTNVMHFDDDADAAEKFERLRKGGA